MTSQDKKTIMTSLGITKS